MTEFTTSRRVEFADTDVVGICHFARFFVFMESAEHEMFESLGSGPLVKVEGEFEAESRTIGWPRVSATCDYRRPVRFRDRLEIAIRVLNLGDSSLTCGYRFSHDGQTIAEGRMTTVCCNLDDAPRPIPIPTELRNGLKSFLATA